MRILKTENKNKTFGRTSKVTVERKKINFFTIFYLNKKKINNRNPTADMMRTVYDCCVRHVVLSSELKLIKKIVRVGGAHLKVNVDCDRSCFVRMESRRVLLTFDSQICTGRYVIRIMTAVLLIAFTTTGHERSQSNNPEN